MSFFAGFLRGLVAILLCACANGCLPSGQTQYEEEKESHYLAGKNCINSMDYGGAIEAFEKAAEVNPRSGSAHFQLGILYEEREHDPAAAIYHYERYLKLHPDPEKVEWINQRIVNCKQDLSKTLLLPVPPGMQHEFEKLAEENKRLREENEKMKAEAASRSPQPVANSAVPIANHALPNPNPGSSSVPTESARSGRAPNSTPRVHVVQPGDTPASVARKYRIRLDDLLRANPGLVPKRMQVGKPLNIPSG